MAPVNRYEKLHVLHVAIGRSDIVKSQETEWVNARMSQRFFSLAANSLNRGLNFCFQKVKTQSGRVCSGGRTAQG
jgi:hypothetical protein